MNRPASEPTDTPGDGRIDRPMGGRLDRPAGGRLDEPMGGRLDRPAGGRHAWIDASAGVAGDMLLGALIDAGASLAVVQSAVDAVAGGSVRVRVREVSRAGLRALKAEVEALGDDPPHRTWRDVREMLKKAGAVTGQATAVFRRLAEAEARVHGVQPDDVHFHEVGALDAIADVVGCCVALADLGVTTVSAGPVALGSGSVRSQHGRLPVPAPAVAELAKGWQVSGGGAGELATPTGLALLRALALTCESLPPMVMESVGIGAGTRDPADRANIVRVLIGTTNTPLPARPRAAELVGPAPYNRQAVLARRELNDGQDLSDGQQLGRGRETLGDQETSASRELSSRQGEGGERAEDEGPRRSIWLEERAVLLEANVDDLDPRLWPGILAGLLRRGASDAWLVPIVMKKGRPAHTLSVLCPPERAEQLREQIFRDTSTLGVRHSPHGKVALDRGFADVTVGDTRIPVKVGHCDGTVFQVMPEFDDVAALARRLDRPERLVLQEALAAAAEAGLTVGGAVPAHLRPAM